MAQGCVAGILEKLLQGGLDGCDPALWSQRAFWLLAGTIYQRLAVDCEAIETAELVSLAKALAENRRAEGHATSPLHSSAASSEGGGEAKDQLRQLVHELYGLHLPDGAEAPDARKP
ncbi:MAG: hypothetical protein IT449_03725 [Phycisphaerales bacterium]|nr:hypothetical protein [Phycisphaerales bacterium]